MRPPSLPPSLRVKLVSSGGDGRGSSPRSAWPVSLSMAARQTIDTSGSSSSLPWCHCPLFCLPNRTLRPLTLFVEPYGRPGGRPTGLLGVVITVSVVVRSE